MRRGGPRHGRCGNGGRRDGGGRGERCCRPRGDRGAHHDRRRLHTQKALKPMQNEGFLERHVRTIPEWEFWQNLYKDPRNPFAVVK